MYWITKTFLKEWVRISIGFLTWFDNPNLERVQKWLYHLLHHWIFEESGSKEKSIEIQMKKALNYFFSKARFFFIHKEGLWAIGSLMSKIGGMTSFFDE